MLTRSPAPAMFSARSLAERWDCHRDTVYKMIDRGELSARRIGGMVRIPAEAVRAIEEGERWLDEREGTGSSSAEREESGDSAGLRIVASGPEALARQMKARRTSGSIDSSLSSISRPGQPSRP